MSKDEKKPAIYWFAPVYLHQTNQSTDWSGNAVDLIFIMWIFEQCPAQSPLKVNIKFIMWPHSDKYQSKLYAVWLNEWMNGQRIGIFRCWTNKQNIYANAHSQAHTCTKALIQRELRRNFPSHFFSLSLLSICVLLFIHWPGIAYLFSRRFAYRKFHLKTCVYSTINTLPFGMWQTTIKSRRDNWSNTIYWQKSFLHFCLLLVG